MSLEFVLTVSLKFFAQVVVASLGATAIAAVGFANSLMFIPTFVLGALATSVSIIVARAHGAGRYHYATSAASVAVLVALTLSAVISVPALAAPQALLHLTGASATVAAAGSDYLRLAAAALVPTVAAAVLGGVLRSTGRPRSALAATLSTVLLNAVLAPCLVLGIGGSPALGVSGAGWATLIAASFNAVVLAVLVFGRRAGSHWRWSIDRRTASSVLGPLVVLAAPLAVTQLFWTTGTFLYSVLFQRLGDHALAAAQIVATLEGLFIVGSIGLMSATTTLVGAAVGAGEPGQAAAWARRMSRLGVHSGLFFGALFGLSTLTLGSLFGDAGADVRHAATVGILINAAFQVVKVRNMILGAGVLPSGNDVRGVIIGDIVGAFGVGLPLAVLLGLYTPLGLAGVFVARGIEELGKQAVFRWRVHRLDWQTVAQHTNAATT